MNNDSPFNLPISRPPTAESAEGLLSLLSRPDREIQQLWSHQADALREFHARRGDADVAIELPTGSGKTLVASLIAEWTRRSSEGRVLYLCPDNALVKQVQQKASGYGIEAVAFTGGSARYAAGDVARFNAGEVIGVTSYWTIFNANPRLAPTHIIIDDAHSAGPAIASNWTVELSRTEYPDAFSAILDLFGSWVAGDLRYAIQRDAPSSQVSMIPTPVLDRASTALSNIMDAHLPDGSAASFSWRQVRDHLSACNLFVSRRTVVLRPFIPPTHSLRAFSDARQRIYLSATLGRDGDLERTVGRSPIRRISSSLKGSIGRRFVLFADAGLAEDEQNELFASVVTTSDRVVMLLPSEREADEMAGRVLGVDPQRQVLRNADIRESYEPFVRAPRAALVLANRYDGIDLPGEVCRTLLLAGLPSAGDLQERFLWSQLGAHGALWERVTTRLSQGLGRTARGFQDYTLAMLYGDDLLDFVTNSDRIATFNPVLGAELKLARAQIQAPLQQRRRAVESFFNQDDDWQGINRYLAAEVQAPVPAPPQSVLAEAASHEVAFSRAIWDGRYDDAVRQAKTLVDELDGTEMTGYRAWWALELSAAAYWMGKTDDEYLVASSTALDDGRRTGANGGIFSIAKLALQESQRGRSEQPTPATVEDETTERIVRLLTELGYSSTKFEAHAKALLDNLRQTESRRYELALEALGQWVGFRTWRPNTQSAPDSVWYLSSAEAIGIEAKSEKTSDELAFRDLREADTHASWIRGNDKALEEDALLHTLIASPCSKYDGAAADIAGRVAHFTLEEVLALAEEAVSQLRRLRERIANGQDQARARQLTEEMLAEASLTPRRLIARLGDHLMSDRLTASGAS